MGPGPQWVWDAFCCKDVDRLFSSLGLMPSSTLYSEVVIYNLSQLAMSDASPRVPWLTYYLAWVVRSMARELGCWKTSAGLLLVQVPSFVVVSIINRLKKKFHYLVKIWEAEVWNNTVWRMGRSLGSQFYKDLHPLVPLPIILDSWPLLYWRPLDSIWGTIRKKIFSRR